jgi:hypothetical protein
VKTLAGFGCENLPLAIAAAGAVLHYLKSNQPSNENTSPLLHLNHLWTFSLAEYMTLDVATPQSGIDRALQMASLPQPHNVLIKPSRRWARACSLGQHRCRSDQIARLGS